MRKLSLLGSLFILMNSMAWAQQETIYSHIAVEVDPIAYIFKGYSVHGVYQIAQKVAFDAGIFAIEEPSFYSDNKDFSKKHKGIGVKIHYYLTEKNNGFYMGVGTGFSTLCATHKPSVEEKKDNYISAGFHAGYRFFIFNKYPVAGLYITPWASLDYHIKNPSLQFTQGNFSQQKWTVFPTLHIGYQF